MVNEEPAFCALGQEESLQLITLLSHLAILLRDITENGQVEEDDVQEAREALTFWLTSFFDLLMNEEQVRMATAYLRQFGVIFRKNTEGEIIVARIQH